MRKWFRNALAIVVVAVFAGVAYLALRGPAEPNYQGKPLTVWLQRYDNSLWQRINLGEPEADEAVDSIGTNAIPILLHMLQARDSDLTFKLLKLAQQQHFIKIKCVPAGNMNSEAMYAFLKLGARASNAVPEMIRIYSLNLSEESQNYTVISLGRVGPAAKSAVPLLLRAAATNTDYRVWANSLWALGFIHSEPETVVPILTKWLHVPRADTHCIVAEALGQFGMDAKPATASLLELLEDHDSKVREVAFHAIGQIYYRPELSSYTKWWWYRALPESFSPSTLIGVINYFGTMGTNAAPAVPALKKFLDDPDEGVRVSATNALKAIDPEAAAKAGVK